MGRLGGFSSLNTRHRPHGRDLNVSMLARMFDRRCRGYEAIGYTILLPASAVPGWPADVVLPSDPVWKRDYSGSVRRLIRDGVDAPLASQFVHAARAMPEDGEGAARARSATEAFLYRRLDTLTETSGRFRLNVALPTLFDGFGTLEVDLLCADARVVIEVDGGQHLADPVAYRRDRRKDQLLTGERLLRAALSCRGCGQGIGRRARCDPEGARSASPVGDKDRASQVRTARR